MSLRIRIAACFLLLGLAGCLMPGQGTPVFVDMRAGTFWSGEGMLVEVSPDKKSCRVAVRDRALIVKHLWVDCRWVHQQHER